MYAHAPRIHPRWLRLPAKPCPPYPALCRFLPSPSLASGPPLSNTKLLIQDTHNAYPSCDASCSSFPRATLRTKTDKALPRFPIHKASSAIDCRRMRERLERRARRGRTYAFKETYTAYKVLAPLLTCERTGGDEAVRAAVLYARRAAVGVLMLWRARATLGSVVSSVRRVESQSGTHGPVPVPRPPDECSRRVRTTARLSTIGTR
ncbi:hypothetical protein BD309DRAFT_974257 [Dichomitus squalens]|nr:hypothetical protein BD309DRAFT_974257 [Dichomitus squalens]